MGPAPRWFIAGVILILAVPILTVLLNYSPLSGMVKAALRSRAGVEVSSFQLRLLPRPGIELRDVVMTSASDPDAVFRASRAALSLRLAPLFQKRLAFVEIRVAQPKIVVRRDSGGRWHFPFIEKTPHRQNHVRTTDDFTLEWVLPDVDVQGGELTVIDDAARGRPPTLVLTDVHVALHSHVLRRQADVALTAALGDGGITVNGLVSLLRIEPDPAPAAIPLGFDGTVELTRFDLAPWVTGSGASAQPLDLTAHVALSPGTLGYDAAVSDIHAALRWVRVHGQGLIRHAGTGQTAYSVTFSATPLSAAVLLKELPEDWIPANVRAAVTEHALAGTVEVMSTSLSGFVGLPPAWHATAKLSEGQGRFGPDRLPVRDVAASVFATQDHLELLNLSGTMGGMKLSDGRLEVAHFDAAPALDLTLAGSGTVGELVTLLHDFSEGAAGENVLKTITNPEGEVQLSIHAVGALVPEPRVALVSADITVHDLGAYLPHLKLAVEHLEGTVGVRGELIDLKHLRGTVGPIAFDAAGTAEMGDNPRFDDVTVGLSAQGGDLAQWVSAGAGGDDDFIVRGPAHSVLRLSGPVSEPAFNGRLDLTQLDIDAAAVRKRAGVAAAVQFKGTLVRQELVSLHDVSLVLPSARVDGRGQVRVTRPVRFDLSLEGRSLPVAGLSEAFVVGPLEDGVLDAAVTVKGQNGDWRSWPITGRLSLRRGLLVVPGLHEAVHDVDATVELAAGDVAIHRLAFRIGDSEVSATGIVKQWASEPSPTLQVESSNLDLTRLLPMREGAEQTSGVEALRQWVARGRADVTARIDQARYQLLAFRTLAAHLHAEPGAAELVLTKGEAVEGTVSGRVRLSARGDQPLLLDGDLHIDGMPVHHVLSMIDSDPDRLRGRLAFDGRVEGSLQAAVPVLTTVTSREPMHLTLTDGRVVHGTVLPKVLKLLNVPAVLGKVDFDRDGIPFDAVSATVTAEGGVLSSENLRFESPLMKVTGAGTWNVVTDDLNLALAVSPFGAYSDVIGKIPLFGRLLEGDRPGLTTALFEVTGPLEDPNVRYLPIESVAKGLTGYPRLAIDLLRNTVSLPFELMTPAAP